MRYIILFLTIFCLPVFATEASLSCADCSAAASKANNPYLHLITAIGEENRGYLKGKRKELGLTIQEANLIRGASGVIECKYSDDPNATAVLSGALIGSDDRVTTNIHVFKGNLDLAKCTFRNFLGSKEISLEFSQENLDAIDSFVSSATPIEGDQIVVKLKRPVGADPYEVDMSGEIPAVGSELIGVTSSEDDFYNRQLAEPIVRSCNVKDPFPAPAKGFKSDCDLEGGSGGVNLFRNRAGHLVARSLFKGFVKFRKVKPGDPYNPVSHFATSAVLNPSNYPKNTQGNSI